MGLLSGLASLGRTLFAGAAQTGGGALVSTGTRAAGALATLGRAAVGPVGQGIAGGVAGAAIGSQIFGGGGAVGPAPGGAVQAIAAAGGQVIQQLTGGRVLGLAPDGSVATFTRDGNIVRPSRIIPAGEPLPAGARVVSISADRTRIGITLRRRRRAFSTEVRRVRNTIRGCRAVLSAAEKPRRRSSHA